MKSYWILVIVFLVAAQVGPAIGDIVYTRDGGQHEGAVREEEDAVFIETVDGIVGVPAEDVLYISVVASPVPEEEPPAGESTLDEAIADPAPTPDDQGADQAANTPTAHADYFVIPIYGEIGVEAHVDTLTEGFNVASIQQASVVILHIDSGGGMLTMKNEILDLLRERKQEFRIVAYVTQAHSAAAMISLICDEIVMAPQGAIGGCVPYYWAAGGAPEVDAKFLAIETGKLRAIAEEGGHNSLLADAMIDYDMVLSYNETDDGVELVRGEGEEVIKNAGQILDITAEEAVTYGLALGIAESVEDVKQYIEIESWTETSQRGYIIQGQWEQELSDAQATLDRLMEQYYDKWDDLVAACNANEHGRAFRLVNELQTCIRKARGIAIRYEGILTDITYRETCDERLRQLAKIEAAIASELTVPNSQGPPIWQEMSPPGAD